MAEMAMVFAFGWAGPAMLGWLAAAAAPLLIHLWSRRRHRETRWAAMSFLLAAVRRSRRRIFLEQWGLLALRTALIALVVVAAAEPFWERGMFAGWSGERTHWTFVIDGSYSMRAKPDEKSRFDRAKEQAAKIVEGCSRGDAFSLVLMASPPRVVVGTPAYEPSDFLRELESLSTSETTFNLAATLEAADKTVQAAAWADSHIARHEVVFLTDLCRQGWRPTSDAVASAKRHAAELAEKASITVLDVGEGAVENAAVTSLTALDGLVTPGRSTTLAAETRNFGRTAQDRTASLWIDDREIARKPIRIEPGEAASVTFNARFETPGDHAAEVRLDPDRLDLDDRRGLSVPVRAEIAALCVAGRTSAEPMGGSADFLALALAPDEEGEDAGTIRAGSIRTQTISESELAERRLGRYDIVFLCDVAQFSPREAQALEGYAASGGCVVFFLGDRVRAEAYQREWGRPSKDRERFLPADLGQVVAEGIQTIDPHEYRHEILRPFRGRERSGLLTAPVMKHVKTQLPADGRTTVVASLTDGDPLILERRFGRGRVFLVTTSADANWSALPIWPCFVPLAQEWADYGAALRVERQNVEVGQAMEGTLPAEGAGLVRIRRPDGGEEAVRAESADDVRRWRYDSTDRAGFYTLEADGVPPRRFAARLNTAESDLATLGEEELREEIWQEVPFTYATSWRDEEAAAPAAGERARLPTAVLLAALALAMVELWIARRAGAPRP